MLGFVPVVSSANRKHEQGSLTYGMHCFGFVWGICCSSFFFFDVKMWEGLDTQLQQKENYWRNRSWLPRCVTKFLYIALESILNNYLIYCSIICDYNCCCWKNFLGLENKKSRVSWRALPQDCNILLLQIAVGTLKHCNTYSPILRFPKSDFGDFWGACSRYRLAGIVAVKYLVSIKKQFGHTDHFTSVYQM